MISIEDLEIYLPKYLSPESQEKLFDALNDFPDNIDARLYTTALRGGLTTLQGDGIRDLPVVHLPDPAVRNTPVLILSNSCDINHENKRYLQGSICYAPILKLNKYRRVLLDNAISEEKVRDHIRDIRIQRITQIFFLPKGGEVREDSIVFFDQVNHCVNTRDICADLNSRRLFTLSQYGHYLFLLKLSIHFTRLTEGIDRSSI